MHSFLLVSRGGCSKATLAHDPYLVLCIGNLRTFTVWRYKACHQLLTENSWAKASLVGNIQAEKPFSLVCVGYVGCITFMFWNGSLLWNVYPSGLALLRNLQRVVDDMPYIVRRWKCTNYRFEGLDEDHVLKMLLNAHLLTYITKEWILNSNALLVLRDLLDAV